MKKSSLLGMLSLFICVNAELRQIPGAVDTSFGTSGPGFTLLNMGGTIDSAGAIVLDSQGRILLGGNSDAVDFGDFAVARFNPNGLVDLSFGPDGTGFTLFNLGATDLGRAMVLDNQGRILLGGVSDVLGTDDFAVARFTPDGIVDTTFGTSGPGFTVLDLGGSEDAPAIALDNQQRILLAGQSDAVGPTDFAVARFGPDGEVDLSFGSAGTGFTLLNLGGTDIVFAMVLDNQGRILLAGNSDAAGTGDFAVARFSPDGIVDLSFGPNGTGFTLFTLGGALDSANAMVLDSQGRIILAGHGGAGVDFAIARFTPDGIVDTSFGTSGPGFTLLNLGGGFDSANAMVLDSQGRILLGGNSDVANPGDFAVARFSSDGEVDLSFGTSGPGFTLLNLGGTDIASAMVQNSQGQILLAGQGGVGTDFAVARFFEEQFVACALAIREKYCFLP